MFRQAVFRGPAVPVQDRLSDVPGLFGENLGGMAHHCDNAQTQTQC